MSMQRIYLNKYDLTTMLEIINKFPEYEEKNFELHYDNSSGIGYCMYMVIGCNLNGIDGDFKIRIADESDW